MDPRFVAIGQLVLNAVHIASVDLRVPGTAHVQLSNGNVFTFVADEAAAVAAFFKAVNAPAPPAVEPPHPAPCLLDEPPA